MIEFSCPTCGRKHAARDVNGGRRGFCECGTVVVVPGAGEADQNEKPKIIGQIDLHSHARHIRYFAITGVVIGMAIVAALIYGLFFYDTWEGDNTKRLLAMKADADAFVSARQDEKAKAKYEELFSLVAGQVIKSDFLRGEIEAARNAMFETDNRLAPLIQARAAAQRQRDRESQIRAAEQAAAAKAYTEWNSPESMRQRAKEEAQRVRATLESSRAQDEQALAASLKRSDELAAGFRVIGERINKEMEAKLAEAKHELAKRKEDAEWWDKQVKEAQAKLKEDAEWFDRQARKDEAILAKSKAARQASEK